jgi:hypothetical protein
LSRLAAISYPTLECSWGTGKSVKSTYAEGSPLKTWSPDNPIRILTVTSGAKGGRFEGIEA